MKAKPLNMIIPCALASTVLAFSWIAVDDIGGLVAFSIFYGFFSGSFVSLPPSIVASLTPDLHKVGTWMGMGFSITGLGVLIGTPIAGAILNLETGDFLRAQIFCGILVALASGLMISARIAKVGVKVFVKA